jgi:hypothetical protein
VKNLDPVLEATPNIILKPTKEVLSKKEKEIVSYLDSKNR